MTAVSFEFQIPKGLLAGYGIVTDFNSVGGLVLLKLACFLVLTTIFRAGKSRLDVECVRCGLTRDCPTSGTKDPNLVFELRYSFQQLL